MKPKEKRMKKELMILLMITSTVMIVSAKGKPDEADETFYGRGSQGNGMMRQSDADDTTREEWLEQREAERAEYLETLEVVSVSGSLQLVNGELPFIENDGVKYTFRAPWQQFQELDLENGMNVTVEGYEMPVRAMIWDGSEKSIMVTKAIVKGEEIIVEHEPGKSGHGGFGSRGGRGRNGGSRDGGRMSSNS
jgi:hypothetical protein